MRKIVSFLFSMPFSGILILILAVAIAWGTFIENSSGTVAAKTMVYDSPWFIGMLILFVINLCGSILVNRLISRKKWAIFLFHLSFIIIVIGGAVTRFNRMEGTMHLREGKSADSFLTDEAYIEVDISDGQSGNKDGWKVRFAERTRNRFEESIELKDESVSIKLIEFIPGTKGFSRNEMPDNDTILFNISARGEIQELMLTGRKGVKSLPVYTSIGGLRVSIQYGSLYASLPFSLILNDFQIERYPGSNSPSSLASEITLIDPDKREAIPFRIFMNNVLRYKGYRFFQATHDEDDMGTSLNVNYDFWGTTITYFGYLIMVLGMVFTLFSKNSRFISLVKASAKLGSQRNKLLLILILLASGIVAEAQEVQFPNRIDESHAKAFGELLVQTNEGRIEPVNTLASKIIIKISGMARIADQSPRETLLDMMSDPDKWMNQPVIKVSGEELNFMLGINGDYISFNELMEGGYKLAPLVKEAYDKKPSERSGRDKDILLTDERMNVFYSAIRSGFLRIFPIPDDPENTWVYPGSREKLLPAEDMEFAIKNLTNYYSSVLEAQNTGNWGKAESYLNILKENQRVKGASVIPSKAKISLEIFYIDINIFNKLAKLYLLMGVALLALSFLSIFKPRLKIRKFLLIGTGMVLVLFIIQTSGLIIRWYISDHAPWTNGYESMIFISWACALSGLIFARKSGMTLALTTLLAAITLLVAGMNWMNPALTNLSPVLNSYWLIIHVAIITAGYGFLGIGALLGMTNLILMILRKEANKESVGYSLSELSYIIEISLIIGLFLMTIGSFIGGVWANESWGRYWGWDPKESWSLITILVYAFIVHMHKIPFLKGQFQLSTAALLGFGTVLMTYFGVNYYFSGLHSYATGESASLPIGLFVAILIILIVVIYAFFSTRIYDRK